MKLRYSFCILAFFAATLAAQAPKSPPATEPDARFKADVLLVVAHPDDETGVSAYLAQLIDQHKRVAAVYLTHGEAGHNNMGPERAIALGAVREMELRHAMTKVGVENVWFLNGRDTPSQNVLQSLANWHNGAALEEVVRMVRLTRQGKPNLFIFKHEIAYIAQDTPSQSRPGEKNGNSTSAGK